MFVIMINLAMCLKLIRKDMNTIDRDMCVYVFVCKYVCRYVFIYVCNYVCLYAYRYVCMQAPT